ncbi:Sur-8 [Carabus blaptoides fortunei]
MFRKNKTDYKAKLEHKLYLARENPEPVFDLSDCGLRQVPSGIYSLCRVFLKESLQLDHNKLTSLSNGGVLRDLCGVKILNLQFNSFTLLPDDLSSLSNLIELYLNDNNLKKLPKSIGTLAKLRILDVSNNALRALPSEIGNLKKLQCLTACGNKHLNHLPPAICAAKQLVQLSLDAENFVFPPEEVVSAGTETIMRYICAENGVVYEPPTDISPDEEPTTDATDEPDGNSGFELQKQQDILKFEKEYDSFQRQELELQAALKANRQKFLTDLSEQQIKLESDLAKIQQKKEEERLRLVKELQDVEIKADLAITNLLDLMREPMSQLLEHELQEEQKLLAAAAKHNCNLRRNDVLDAMQNLLQEETERFKEYDHNREETARSILSLEMMSEGRLADSDLADKRVNLSGLLLDLIGQQDQRRCQLLRTLKNMEDMAESQQDFWLLQYQQLLDSRPAKMTDIQKNIDPEFAQELLLAGVIQYLPFLAEWAQTADEDTDLTDAQLLAAGIKKPDDRILVLQAFVSYRKLRTGGKLAEPVTTPCGSVVPSAPPAKLEPSTSICASECVICMDKECEIIFVPCGHMCCCSKCCDVTDCPMCRGTIERKIKVILA